MCHQGNCRELCGIALNFRRWRWCAHAKTFPGGEGGFSVFSSRRKCRKDGWGEDLLFWNTYSNKNKYTFSRCCNMYKREGFPLIHHAFARSPFPAGEGHSCEPQSSAYTITNIESIQLTKLRAETLKCNSPFIFADSSAGSKPANCTEQPPHPITATQRPQTWLQWLWIGGQSKNWFIRSPKMLLRSIHR